MKYITVNMRIIEQVVLAVDTDDEDVADKAVDKWLDFNYGNNIYDADSDEASDFEKELALTIDENGNNV